MTNDFKILRHSVSDILFVINNIDRCITCIDASCKLFDVTCRTLIINVFLLIDLRSLHKKFNVIN